MSEPEHDKPRNKVWKIIGGCFAAMLLSVLGLGFMAHQLSVPDLKEPKQVRAQSVLFSYPRNWTCSTTAVDIGRTDYMLRPPVGVSNIQISVIPEFWATAAEQHEKSSFDILKALPFKTTEEPIKTWAGRRVNGKVLKAPTYTMSCFRTKPGKDGFEIFVMEFQSPAEDYLSPAFNLIEQSFEPRTFDRPFEPQIQKERPAPPQNGLALVLTESMAEKLLAGPVTPDSFSKDRKTDLVTSVGYLAKTEDEPAPHASVSVIKCDTNAKARTFFDGLKKNSEGQPVSGLGEGAFRIEKMMTIMEPAHTKSLQNWRELLILKGTSLFMVSVVKGEKQDAQAEETLAKAALAQIN
jgi:hypothetical protein